MKISDGEARLIGTVSCSTADATDRHYLSDAILGMKDAERGAWKLVRAYHKVYDHENFKGRIMQETKNYLWIVG